MDVAAQHPNGVPDEDTLTSFEVAQDILAGSTPLAFMRDTEPNFFRYVTGLAEDYALLMDAVADANTEKVSVYLAGKRR